MIWIYTLVSVLIVSSISLLGVFTLSFDQKKLYKFLIYFVSLSAGTLLGDAFIHLIPESYENNNQLSVSLFLLLGILFFFVMEKVIHWRHCHEKACDDHPHPFSYMILVGDGIHNFIDGLIIGASFMISVPVGIATTVAVIFHEIPQEIGDFGSLVYGGFSIKKALFFNFLSGIFAFFGAIIIIAIGVRTESAINFLVPFAAGGFIYIASSDLIPELHKHRKINEGIYQIIAFVLGIGIMLMMLGLE